MWFISKILTRAAICAVLVGVSHHISVAQAKRPIRDKSPAASALKVTRVDIEGLRTLLRPKDKPRLINFWATWCDPCREEFPELVKLDAAYKGRIDFLTVSLDDLADINTSVLKFLGEMKAEMPAYLLRTADESAAIQMVSKDWAGNLPMTILYAPDGRVAFSKNKKVRYEELAAEIDKLLTPQPVAVDDLN